MIYTSDRNGRVTGNDSAQDQFLTKLYGSRTGRFLLKPLVSSIVSEVAGKFLDSRLSSVLVEPFIRTAGIDMDEYEPVKYNSYNDFFTRKIREGARKTEADPRTFISPCDLSLIHI